LCALFASGLTMPTRAQSPTEQKGAGLVRRVLAPPALNGDIFDATSALEIAVNGVSPDLTRAGQPRLDFLMQLGDRPGPEIPGITPGAVAPPAVVVLGNDPAFVRKVAENEAVISVQLHRPPDIRPNPVRPFNRDARRSHLVEELTATYDVMGDRMTAAVFDGGSVRQTHVEFRSDPANPASTRVQLRTNQSHDRHATHVAGTLGARGIRPQALGMAPLSRILSFFMGDDFAALAGLDHAVDVTNHSYGPVTGWSVDDYGKWYWWGDRTMSELEDARFGKYTGQESAIDGLLTLPAHDSTLMFVAAGNDRNDTPGRQPIVHSAQALVGGRLEWRTSTTTRRDDGYDGGGVDTVSGYCVAKNVVCVGSINDVVSAGTPITMTDYSSWGPTDDGRIKPDLVANGQYLLSAADADDEAYANLPGTSMASPVAAGIGLLLGEEFRERKGRRPLSTELKAVLIHTAADAGEPGPDPIYGWGAINALEAGHVVAKSDRHVIATIDVPRGQTVTLRFSSLAGNEKLRVTGVWADPAAAANQGGLDDSTRVLRNDIDLALVSDRDVTSYPYSLNTARPLARATATGPNRVDNVEVIDATPRANATWELRISGSRIVTGNSQRITIVTSGLAAVP
jgi:subtilisin family serine protease